MRLFPDSWYVEIDEEEGTILDYLYLAIKNAGFEGKVFSQGSGTGFLLKEFRVTDLGEIYVYRVTDTEKIAIEINMDEKNREGFKKILKGFLFNYPKRPWGIFNYWAKKKWDEISD